MGIALNTHYIANQEVPRFWIDSRGEVLRNTWQMEGVGSN